MKKSVFLLLTIMALTGILTACTRSASQAPALPQATAATDITAQPDANDQMSILQIYATQTAMAESGMPAPTEETPPTPESNATPEGSLSLPTAEPALPTLGPALSTPEPVLPTAAPAPSGNVPAITVPGTYALQPGEFPYCIARRFNVNPDELLSLNGLNDGGTYLPGLVLRIPQTGNPFPGARALRPHPTTYTVGLNDTIYRIACAFGDVSPEQIAAANGLSAPYSLQVGQVINIP